MKNRYQLFFILFILFSLSIIPHATSQENGLDDTDLIASWTFDDNTAIDTSGNNHH